MDALSKSFSPIIPSWLHFWCRANGYVLLRPPVSKNPNVENLLSALLEAGFEAGKMQIPDVGPGVFIRLPASMRAGLAG